MNLHISKLKKHYDKSSKIFYYYTDSMLKDDIIIKFKADYFLSVAILDHKNAQEFVMTSGDFTPIEYRRIVEDILSIYEQHTKVEFTQIIRELAVIFSTGRKQPTKEQKEEMFSQLIWEISLIETVEMMKEAKEQYEDEALDSQENDQ
jgi:hypothetical protein